MIPVPKVYDDDECYLATPTKGPLWDVISYCESTEHRVVLSILNQLRK